MRRAGYETGRGEFLRCLWGSKLLKNLTCAGFIRHCLALNVIVVTYPDIVQLLIRVLEARRGNAPLGRPRGCFRFDKAIGQFDPGVDLEARNSGAGVHNSRQNQGIE